jgi:hypothetical protein
MTVQIKKTEENNKEQISYIGTSVGACANRGKPHSCELFGFQMIAG